MTQFIVRKIILVLMIAVIYSCNLEKENKSTASKTQTLFTLLDACLLYTSDAADE